MAKVSVIIPTYNRADVLPRCLDSVVSQTYENIEIIVVDDCSTDETAKTIKEYNHPLKFIQHEENRGGSAARNTGIDAASGDYIAFLDSDDEWLPQKIEKQVELIEQSSKLGLVYTGLYFSEDGERRVGRVPSARGYIYKEMLKKDRVGPTSTVLVRKECLESTGKFDPDLPARQDYDLWIRLSEDYEFNYLTEPLVVIYTDRSDRISSDYEQRIQADEILLDRIESRASEFSFLERRKILSKQYESRAMYSYLCDEYEKAKEYCQKSITIYPFGRRRWYLSLLLGLSIDRNHALFTQTRNLTRKMKSTLQQFNIL